MKERIHKLIEDLSGLIYSDTRPVNEYRMKHLEGEERTDILAEDTSLWEQMTVGQLWGGHREYFYFETFVTIPEEWKGKKVIYSLSTGQEEGWDAMNPQFLAYVNDVPRMGLDRNHREIVLANSARGGEKFRILLSAFTGDNNFSLQLCSSIRVLETEIEKYYYDLKVPYEVARLLPEDNPDRRLILGCLSDSLNLIDLRKPYSDGFYDSLKIAQDNLEKEFYEKHCGGESPTVYCVGHTHIDVAWLWTLRVTEDKAVRSFTSMTELMRQYPEFIFMSSQPQLYKFVKKLAPDLYEEIRKLVAEGRWEPEGGMFLEADCNLASGESLVRQFLYGTRFFEQEFGVKNRILWLPDVFGYSAALPQIMKKCGIDYFMTTKISWNECNKLPYDTFMWEGIDGTEVLAHFVPTRDYGRGAEENGTATEHFTTYNGYLNASQVMGAWQRYSQKDLNSEVLMSYGFGDGGGGTTKDMLENQRRLSRGIPGAPRTVTSTALQFFETLEKNVEGNRELPRWVGELYLEYHRGTYTSMARNKKFNRRAEFSCQDLELFAMIAKTAAGSPYPKQELDDAWEIVLRNQFHDILPGSSIREVYEDSRAEYQKLFALTDRLTASALSDITDQIDAPSGSVIFYNPNSLTAAAPVLLSDDCFKGRETPAGLVSGDLILPVQPTEDGFLVIADGIPSKGYRAFAPSDALPAGDNKPLVVTEKHVETPYFEIELNEKGQFCRIYDKEADRELLPEGQCANVIMSYEDRPHNYDAWDINNYYTEKSWEVDDVTSLAVTEEGPVRGCIRVERSYLDSVIVQYLYFYRDLKQIDIRNEIDWHEKQILLRDYIPADIHANEATYEIQYGNVQRPTHFNTSWDAMKFEVCAHKWIDFSEDGYGVSVLNDCKFGCDIHNGVIGLTMLKSAVHPNTEADREHHSFRWSICPHTGGWRKSETVAKAYLLNNPYFALQKERDGGSLPAQASYLSVDRKNVVIEAVKKAEDSEDLIVRLYECYNRRCTVTLTACGELKSAAVCNMLEEEEEQLRPNSRSVSFEMKPYEIKTLKLQM